jgi:hypothetical protein
MAQINLTNVYKVVIIESERGWGQKVIDTLYFDNESEARTYCREHNMKLPEDHVPEYYIMARYEGKV